MTRLSAKDALLGGKPNKYRNKPVWECQSCGMTWHWAPGSKHCAPRCGQNTIIKFASTKEFNRWHELKKAEKAGQIRNLRRQVSYRLEVNGKLICRYVADAVYEECQQATSGIIMEAPAVDMRHWQPVVEDSKGHATPVYKLKAKLMAAGACPEFPEGIDVKET